MHGYQYLLNFKILKEVKATIFFRTQTPVNYPDLQLSLNFIARTGQTKFMAFASQRSNGRAKQILRVNSNHILNLNLTETLGRRVGSRIVQQQLPQNTYFQAKYALILTLLITVLISLLNNRYQTMIQACRFTHFIHLQRCCVHIYIILKALHKAKTYIKCLIWQVIWSVHHCWYFGLFHLLQQSFRYSISFDSYQLQPQSLMIINTIIKLTSIPFQIQSFFQIIQILKPMKITASKNLKEGLTMDFQEALLNQDSSKPVDDAPDMKSFLKDIQTLGLPQIKNQPQIQKIKKKIGTFGKQYGFKTEKTTFIFMSYLETVRQCGVNHLKSKDLLKAASFFADCLRIIDPKHDEIFYQKFLIVKIDAVNKLMYCLFELQSQRGSELSEEQPRDNKSDRYQNAQNILQRFIFEVNQFQKIQSLKKNENCMLELNYFFLGRLYRKTKRYSNAIKEFQKSQMMIKNKLNGKQNIRSEQTRQFWNNLLAKIYYKRSKCYRDQNDPDNQRIKYEKLALQTASENGNLKLSYYIRRKIQFYQAKQQFKAKLMTFETKKKIEDQTFKNIEDSRQTQIKSLYNVYNFQATSKKPEKPEKP